MSKELRDNFRSLVKKVQVTRNNKSAKWFKEVIMDSKKGIKSHVIQVPQVGRLYQFIYDAKTKEDLEFFDVYPLSICVAIGEDRWYSINLHYLPPKVREGFLEDLLVKYADKKTQKRQTVAQSTVLKLDWSKIRNFDQAIFEHALTSYLPSQYKSNLQEIHPKYWHLASTLPSQLFVSYKGKKGKKKGKRTLYEAKKVWSRL